MFATIKVNDTRNVNKLKKIKSSSESLFLKTSILFSHLSAVKIKSSNMTPIEIIPNCKKIEL
jgi:hypothetical protein